MAKELKPYLCKECGTTNPEDFVDNRKSKCRKCRIKETTNRKIEKRGYSVGNKPCLCLICNISDLNKFSKWSKSRCRKCKHSQRMINPGTRMIHNLRRRHWDVLKGSLSTTKELGCNSTFLRSYIENLWESWMNWDNYGIGKGEWSLDHIIPLDTAEKDELGYWVEGSEYNKKLMHYTNIRPFLHDDNVKKSNKLIDIY